MTFVDRGAASTGPWKRDGLLTALGTRRLTEGRRDEARAIALELFAWGQQNLSALHPDEHDDGPRSTIITAARLAQASGDAALSETMLQDLARRAFDSRNAPARIAEVGALWARMCAGRLP